MRDSKRLNLGSGLERSAQLSLRLFPTGIGEHRNFLVPGCFAPTGPALWGPKGSVLSSVASSGNSSGLQSSVSLLVPQTLQGPFKSLSE